MVTGPVEVGMSATDPDEQTRRLAAEALAVDDPTGWFERLYAAAEEGEAVVPWDRRAPHQLLVQWAQSRQLRGAGRRALVVGCGLGRDAEFVAGLGFDTVAFDISDTAVRTARRRFPDTRVRYLVADLLDPPAHWQHAYDLVVESMTIQALPDPPRREAIARVTQMVRPGGTLIVVAAARDDMDDPDPGPPWPLIWSEIDAFTAGGLQAVLIEDLHDAEQPTVHRWRAEFCRPEPGR
jgi:SAM-dependent methyltransferase